MLVRELIKNGAEVKVIITPAAQDFVSSLTLATLSKSPVLKDLFDEAAWANHVMLGRWADIMVIAPLSCNTLSKMANGQCDNLLMATYLSSTCPVIVAPAMDEDMWQHPTTKRNLRTIQTDGCSLIPVEYGELASGLTGEGRMAEPDTIVSHLKNHFLRSEELRDKKVLVTAGPTYEAIDPVRFIGNHSSGKMGYALANEFVERGADVTLISGPITGNLHSNKKINVFNTTSAEEMYTACINRQYDIAVMAAAVADYTPVTAAGKKIKKGADEITLQLKKTPDILAQLGKQKKNGQILVGFALETDNEKQNAIRKLREKNADMIVLNSLSDEGAGFKVDTNRITIFTNNGREMSYGTKPKNLVAKDIVDSITELLKT
jgi:phosphopantothenoylcysteine decarboxylase/phosphopantothenate--cysteine ligase